MCTRRLGSWASRHEWSTITSAGGGWLASRSPARTSSAGMSLRASRLNTCPAPAAPLLHRDPDPADEPTLHSGLGRRPRSMTQRREEFALVAHTTEPVDVAGGVPASRPHCGGRRRDGATSCAPPLINSGLLGPCSCGELEVSVGAAPDQCHVGPRGHRRDGWPRGELEVDGPGGRGVRQLEYGRSRSRGRCRGGVHFC